MSEPASILLSLLPRFAQAILDGTKTAEVRRRRVGAEAGARVILYATSPTKAVVGVARIRATSVSDKEDAWLMHSSALAIKRDEFDAYLGTNRSAFILELEGVEPVFPLLHLADLGRERIFRPPQSFRFVSMADPTELHDL